MAFVSTLRAQKVTELRDFVFLSLGVRDAVQSGAGCVNDACVGNYAPVYVLVEGLGTPLPRVDLKGTWDRGGLGLRPPPPGSTPRRGPPAGAKQSPPTTYGRDESRTLEQVSLWCGFYKKEQGKGLMRRRLILKRGPASAAQRANT